MIIIKMAKIHYINIKDNNNKDYDKKSYDLLILSRLTGLGLLLLAIYISLSSSSVKINMLKLKLNKTIYVKSCNTLVLASSWKPYNDDNNARLPIYRHTISLLLLF